MKNQVLFSSKDKSKILKCCLLHFLVLRIMNKNKQETNIILGCACNVTLDEVKTYLKIWLELTFRRAEMKSYLTDRE